MIREVLALVETDWKVTVVAVTTDCGGEARKAREEIVKERPELITPDCYAHQVCFQENTYILDHKLIILSDRTHCWQLLQIWIKCLRMGRQSR